MGDSASFLQGVAVAAQWLAENRVDACVVVGSEESDWIIADALRHLDRPAVLAAAPGLYACVATRDCPRERNWWLHRPAHLLPCVTNRGGRRAPSAANWAWFLEELLCDGIGDSPRLDAAERAAWQEWSGARLSPKRVLGEGLMAGAAWQCVAACEAVAERTI